MQKGFWFIFVAIIAAMFGLFALTSDGDSESKLSLYDPTKVQLTDHIYGSKPKTQSQLDKILKNKAVFIEYADFQCPACALFAPLLEQLQADFKNQLVVVFRHFPLSSHPQAMAAHRAAVAADNQGKFWEMLDILYVKQNQWSNVKTASTIFEGFAKELGLKMAQFNTDVASAETFDRIQVDIKSSSPFSISATPTFILNGEKIGDFASYDELKSLVQAEL